MGAADDSFEEAEDDVLDLLPQHFRDLIENLPENDPPRAAYHEAGHAVVALHLDLDVVQVEIFENEDEQWEGATTIEWGESSPTEVESDSGNVLPFILAGRVAQLRWDPRQDVSAWGPDEWDIRMVLRDLGEPVASHAHRRAAAEQRAEEYVTLWWDEIRVVAANLIEQHVLSREDLLDLLT